MLYYFYGDDTYAARQAIDALAQKNKAALRWHEYTELETLLREGGGQGASLFGRLIHVVRDVSSAAAAIQEIIVEQVKRLHSGTDIYVLWDSERLDARSRLWRELKPHATEFPALSLPELVRWLVSESQGRGAVLEPAAATLLVERLGADRWRLLSEVEKLLLLDPQIGVERVRVSIPEAPQTTIFACLNAVAAGQARVAVQSVELLLSEGANELYIISMLGYQFRTLLRLRMALDRGTVQRDVPRATGLSSFVIQKNMPHARRFSAAFLHDALTRILGTDLAIKQGKVDPRTGLSMLVMTLSDPVRARPS